MWHVTLTGSPNTMGAQHATLLKPAYLYYLAEVRKALGYAERTDRITRICHRIFTNIQTAFPSLAEEIEGCAAALAISRNDITMLIAFNDLWWGLPWDTCTHDSHHLGDCTNLGFRSQCDEPLLAQTFDLPDIGQFFMHSLHPDRGYALLSVHRLAPSSVSCGVNQCGLCCGGVSSCCQGQDLDGLPINVILRVMLQSCASVDAAIDLMRSHSILSGGYTIQVMQRDGRSVVLECAPGAVEVVEADLPYMYNTRFTSEKMRTLYESVPVESTVGRAENRLSTFARLMQQEPQPYSLETMQRVLSDHSPEGPIWDWTTPCAIIMYPQKASLRIYEGPPNYAWGEWYSLGDTI